MKARAGDVYTVTLGVRYFLCKRQLWVKGCLT